MRVAPKNTSMNTRFWTWPIAIYLFLGGLGGGTIFMAGIIYFLYGVPFMNDVVAYGGMMGVDNAAALLTQLPGGTVGFGIFVGVVMLVLGCLLLIFELGQPKLFVRAFITKTAIIKWGAVLLSVAMIFALIWWVILYWPPQWDLFWYHWVGLANICAIIAMVASMGLMVYTGVLLSTMKARPFWNTPAVPILFTISALSTGCALLSLCLKGCPIKFWMFGPFLGDASLVEYANHFLHNIDIILVIAELIVLLLFLVLQYSSNEVGAKRVARRWLCGETAPIFWIGMVIIGLAIPLVCYLIGGEVLDGLVAPILALCGGLLLRFLFVYNNDRRGIPGEQKYFNRLPIHDEMVANPYWERQGKAY